MKKNKNIISAIIIAAMLVTGCSKDKKELSQTDDQARVEKVATLEMNKDSLDTKVIDDLKEQIVKRKIELTTEALSVIGETHSLLREISKSKKNEAIKKGKELIGSLEILLAKDPELSLIPVDVDFRKNELITDVETVRKTAKLAQKAMDKGYYQLAADLLEGIRSEMVINTSSFGIISSILTSEDENSIFDLLSSPYFSFTSFKSSTKRESLKSSSERIS